VEVVGHGRCRSNHWRYNAIFWLTFHHRGDSM
jgi:hypothetical protein